MGILASPVIAQLLAIAPNLVVQLIAIWHQQGHVTTQEVSDFLTQQWADPNSFFNSPPKAATAQPATSSGSSSGS